MAWHEGKVYSIHRRLRRAEVPVCTLYSDVKLKIITLPFYLFGHCPEFYAVDFHETFALQYNNNYMT